MSAFNIEVESGKSVKLPTAGKYCDRDIVVTATGGDSGGGYDDGYEAGKQAEYDRFWDLYQQNGNRQDCSYLYGGFGWDNTTYKPKYELNPQRAYYMFRTCGIKDGSDLKVDFSNCTDMYMCFAGSKLETLPEIRATGNNVDLYYCFNACYDLKRIEKLVLGETVRRYTAMFTGDANLEHMIVEGVIVYDFQIAHSAKLDAESVQSIIDSLKDLTGATAQKVQFHTDVMAKLTDAQINTIFAKNWTI